ncbi:MAG TPA: hypothetical protein VD884_01395, partial [Ohtaekwangia sp.]|nr:hypothetical protein [Ohtaekwangia sp.]
MPNYFSRVIHVNDEAKQINYLRTERLTIILPFQTTTQDEKCIFSAEELPDLLPRLFLFYPLIGTEKFGFNFVIHSKNFQPTEPRDGLHLRSENEKNRIEEEANRKLMDEASNLIFTFLEKSLKEIHDPHLIAKINFPIFSDDSDLNEYFTGLKEKWTKKFKTLPLLETLTGRISPQDAVFLDSVTIDQADEKTQKAIYNIVGKFYPNMPRPELNPYWSNLTDEWSIDGLERVSFSKIAEKIQEQGTLETFEKNELILLYKEMIRKGEAELFANRALIPTIKGQFRKQVELSRSVDLVDELLTVSDVLNPKISN